MPIALREMARIFQDSFGKHGKLLGTVPGNLRLGSLVPTTLGEMAHIVQGRFGKHGEILGTVSGILGLGSLCLLH